MVRLALAFLLISSLSACDNGLGTVTCSSDATCLRASIHGMCIQSPSSGAKFCAFGDPQCMSGERWDTTAGDGLAGVCVAGAGNDMAMSDMGVPDSAVTNDGPDLWMPNDLTTAPIDQNPLTISDLAGTDLSGNVPQWHSETSMTNANLGGVWATAGSVYVVGSLGAILHSTGNGSWSLQTSTTTQDLSGVWGASGTNVFAVGSNGALIHTTDGSTWSPPISNPAATANQNLYGIWGASATNLYAVGDQARILHSLDGTTWTPLMSIATSGLSSVGGTGAGDVWVVGNQDVILHSTDGINFVNRPSGLAMSHYFSVWASGSDVFVAGQATPGGSMVTATVLHSTNAGGTWSSQTSGAAYYFGGVWGDGLGTVYAASNKGTVLHSSNNGTSWDLQTIAGTHAFAAIWGTSATDVYAVGDGGTIYHFH